MNPSKECWTMIRSKLVDSHLSGPTRRKRETIVIRLKGDIAALETEQGKILEATVNQQLCKSLLAKGVDCFSAVQTHLTELIDTFQLQICTFTDFVNILNKISFEHDNYNMFCSILLSNSCFDETYVTSEGYLQYMFHQLDIDQTIQVLFPKFRVTNPISTILRNMDTVSILHNLHMGLIPASTITDRPRSDARRSMYHSFYRSVILGFLVLDSLEWTLEHLFDSACSFDASPISTLTLSAHLTADVTPPLTTNSCQTPFSSVNVVYLMDRNGTALFLSAPVDITNATINDYFQVVLSINWTEQGMSFADVSPFGSPTNIYAGQSAALYYLPPPSSTNVSTSSIDWNFLFPLRLQLSPVFKRKPFQQQACVESKPSTCCSCFSVIVDGILPTSAYRANAPTTIVKPSARQDIAAYLETQRNVASFAEHVLRDGGRFEIKESEILFSSAWVSITATLKKFYATLEEKFRLFALQNEQDHMQITFMRDLLQTQCNAKAAILSMYQQHSSEQNI